MKTRFEDTDLTQGSPARVLVRFTLPMLLSTAFQQMYTAVDTFVVGKFVGMEPMAAIGATASMINFFLFSSIGISNGLGIVMSQFFGAKNERQITRTAANALIITIVVSLFMGTLGLSLAYPLLKLLHTPQEIIGMSRLYVTIIFAGLFAQLSYNVATSILRALGNTRTPLYFLIFSSILNVVVDLVLVLVFHMGVEGVAIATVSSQGIGAIGCVVYMIRHYPVLRFGWKDMRPDLKIIGRVFRIGVPMGAQSMCFTAGMMVIQSVINSYGTTVVAGYTAGVRVEELSWMSFTVLGHSISNYTGQNAGARDLERIRLGVRSALYLNLIACSFSMLVVYLFARPLLQLFVASGQDEVIRIACGFLYVNAAFYIPMGLIMLYNGALKGMGLIGIPMVSAFIELFSKVGFSLLFSVWFGYIGIWFAEPLGWVLGTIPSAISYYRGGWKKTVMDLDL